MNVLYFPFTFVSGRSLAALNACFQSVHVLLPSVLDIPRGMIQAEGDGRLVLERPPAIEDAAMGEALQQYRDWARAHRGSEMGWLKTQLDSVPFYDESNISRIRSEVTGGSGNPPEHDPLQEARMFLQMAQMYDVETAELESDLEGFEQMEKALFEELKGEPETNVPSITDRFPPSDPGGFMTSGRLSTWARLFMSLAPEPSEAPQVMATTSRIVLETVLEAFPSGERIAAIGSIPVSVTPVDAGNQWRQELADVLSSASVPDLSGDFQWPLPPAGGDATVSLFLYRIPGVTAESMCARWLSAASASVMATPTEVTLLALVECPAR